MSCLKNISQLQASTDHLLKENTVESDKISK